MFFKKPPLPEKKLIDEYRKETNKVKLYLHEIHIKLKTKEEIILFKTDKVESRNIRVNGKIEQSEFVVSGYNTEYYPEYYHIHGDDQSFSCKKDEVSYIIVNKKFLEEVEITEYISERSYYG